MQPLPADGAPAALQARFDHRARAGSAMRWLALLAGTCAVWLMLASPAARAWWGGPPGRLLVVALMLALTVVNLLLHWAGAMAGLGYSAEDQRRQSAEADQLGAAVQSAFRDVCADLPGARVRVVARASTPAALVGRTFVLDGRVAAFLSPAELRALLWHERAHWPARYRFILEPLARLSAALTPVATALAAGWFRGASGALLLSGLVFVLYPVASVLVGPHGQWVEHHCDLVAARRMGGRATAAFLLKLDEHGAATAPLKSARSSVDPNIVSWRDFDRDGDGTLDRAELEHLLTTVTGPSFACLHRIRGVATTHPCLLTRLRYLIAHAPDLAPDPAAAA